MKSASTQIVTGAAGFLGSHLCEKLLSDGHSVVGIDNFCTGSKSNIEYLYKKSEQRFQFIEADIVKPWTWTEEIPETYLSKVTSVFHLASPASPIWYQQLPLETIWANTKGLENALNFANQMQAKLTFASTSEIYGDPQVTPQSESYFGNVNSFGVRSCYDESKRLGEALIFSYNQKFTSKHGLVRIFNTYGPRMNPRDGRVIINFLIQGLKNQNICVYGDGRQTRSFCYVDDLVEGLVAYSQSDIDFPINLGNPEEISILQLAEKVKKLFPENQIQLLHSELPKDDPKKRRPNIQMALRHLPNWSPKVSIDDGLKMMLGWLKENM